MERVSNEDGATLLGTAGTPARTRMLVVGVALAALGAIAATTTAGTADTGTHRLAAALAFALPLIPLLLGAWLLRLRSPHADVTLLVGLPVAIAVGAIARPGAPLDPIVFVVGAALFASFLVLAARALAEAAPAQADAVKLDRPAEPVPPRFRRRLRIYFALRIAAAMAFAVPLAIAALEVATGTQTRPVVLFATAGLLGALACRAFFVDTMERHLQRDPQLARSLAKLRAHARRGRPAPLFYAAAVIALLAMAFFALRGLLGFAIPEAGA